MTVGEKIRKLMQERGMTMEEMSKKAGIRCETVSAICEGKQKPILLTMNKIAKVLGVSVKDLYQEDSAECEESIGLKITNLRIAKGMSIEELAGEAGIAISTLRKSIKNEKTTKLTIIKIANALGVDVQELDPSITE